MSNRRSSHSSNCSYSKLSINESESILLRFLYHTWFGRGFLKILIRPTFSRMIGWFLNSFVSRIFIKPFCHKNNIDLERFLDKKYLSFNDFFQRSLRNTEFPEDDTKLFSPCDGKLSVYKINTDSTFHIKHSIYSIATMIGNEKEAEKYLNGWVYIFRLTPNDYHRYHFFDDGEIINHKKIPGVLHTVRPIAMQKFPIFHENAREVTTLKTKHFNHVLMIEVGALLVGKIKNFVTEGTFKKGCEKGTFEFGGSTIFLIFKKDKIQVLDEILYNTKNNSETVIHFGDEIGRKS